LARTSRLPMVAGDMRNAEAIVFAFSPSVLFHKWLYND